MAANDRVLCHTKQNSRSVTYMFTFLNSQEGEKPRNFDPFILTFPTVVSHAEGMALPSGRTEDNFIHSGVDCVTRLCNRKQTGDSKEELRKKSQKNPRRKRDVKEKQSETLSEAGEFW